MTKSKENRELTPAYYWGPSAMFEEMERFLNDRGRDRLWFPGMMRPAHRVPVVDVREEEDRYVVSAELPGMTKEDVSIEVGDGALEITAKKDREREEKRRGLPAPRAWGHVLPSAPDAPGGRGRPDHRGQTGRWGVGGPSAQGR